MQGIKNSCDLKEGFFPESLVKAGPTLEELEYDTRQTVETEFAFREKHFLEFNQVDDDAPQIRLPINSALKSVVPVSQLRFIFERVGISFNRLTMGFDSGTYDFTTNMLATSTIISGIIELVYGPSPLVGENLLACERLAKLSMNALKDFTVQLSPKTSVEPKSLEALEAHEKLKAKEILDSKCLSCHSTNQIRIPFEDPEKIRNRVLGIHLKGRPQMPLGQPLDVEDQLLLIRYLQEVNSEKD
jgi:hypothetical protein